MNSQYEQDGLSSQKVYVLFLYSNHCQSVVGLIGFADDTKICILICVVLGPLRDYSAVHSLFYKIPASLAWLVKLRGPTMMHPSPHHQNVTPAFQVLRSTASVLSN